MDSVKNDAYYISRIFDDLAFIIRHMRDTDAAAFSAHELLQDSMMFRLIQVSENARKLSDPSLSEHKTKCAVKQTLCRFATNQQLLKQVLPSGCPGCR